MKEHPFRNDAMGRRRVSSRECTECDKHCVACFVQGCSSIDLCMSHRSVLVSAEDARGVNAGVTLSVHAAAPSSIPNQCAFPRLDRLCIIHEKITVTISGSEERAQCAFPAAGSHGCCQSLQEAVHVVLSRGARGL